VLGVGGLKLSIAGSILDHPVHRTILRPYGPKGMDMKTVHSAVNGFQAVLERKESELAQVVRKRAGISIEKPRCVSIKMRHTA